MSSRLFSTAQRLRTLAARVPARTFTSAAVSSSSRCTLHRTAVAAATPVRRFASDAAPAADAAAAPAEEAAAVDPKVVADLQDQLKKSEEKAKELQDKYMRALAENQNTLTRGQKQVADAKQFAVQSFAKQLLEVADILEIATKAAEAHAEASEDANFKNLFEGMTMTQKVLIQTFDRNGLKKFEPLDEKFDPYFHDGIMQMEDATKTPGTVGIVLKSGYRLHERCLRAAQVGTVKAPSTQ